MPQTSFPETTRPFSSSFKGIINLSVLPLSIKRPHSINRPSFWLTSEISARALIRGNTVHNLCLTWYWTSMLWSVDRCQKKVSAGQYHMTLSLCTIHWGDVFLILRWPVIVFQLISGSGPAVFQEEFPFLYLIGESRIVLLKDISYKILPEPFDFGPV